MNALMHVRPMDSSDALMPQIWAANSPILTTSEENLTQTEIIQRLSKFPAP